jgi:glycosyltransferase involved in cell wall biosynthesis
MPLPSLTVVLVTQNAQNRIPRLLEALAKQTLAAELEVFIVYIAPAKPAPVPPDGLRVIPIHQSDIRNMGQARAEAVRRAHSPWVAFLEDHTIPNSRWAEAVCAAFREFPEADAVSYAFLNGSPDTYFYRSVFMAEYGALAHPLRKGMAPAMAANNVAYRRDTLRKIGDGLDSLLEIDYFLQKALGSGFRTATAPHAILAHQTNTHVGDLLRGHFIYAQLFALRRLQFENWSLPKRLAGAAAVPILVPLLRIKRLFQAISGRSNVSRAMAGLPVILLLYCAGALGEAWGLLHRQADPEERLIWLELASERISE